MIVCSCNVFSDTQVRAVIAASVERPRMSRVYSRSAAPRSADAAPTPSRTCSTKPKAAQPANALAHAAPAAVALRELNAARFELPTSFEPLKSLRLARGNVMAAKSTWFAAHLICHGGSPIDRPISRFGTVRPPQSFATSRSRAKPGNVDMLVWSRSFAVPPRRPRSLVELMAIASLGLLMLSCKPETVETTGAANACAAKLYSHYDPANMEQCVDVACAASAGSRRPAPRRAP